MKSVRKFRSIPRSFDEFPIKRLDTLFNLGKAEGSIDGGQMIKPALARGLHLVGATTRMCLMYVTYQDTNFRAAAVAADEYRKTISKDAALERRFQPVTIEEPTVESTISILRGLKPRYEVRLYACPRHLHVHVSCHSYR